jgi:Uma2 family endonuclease
MAAVGALVSVDEYLHTVYEPECDYVDGELEDRNVGERDHATTQGEIYFFLRRHQQRWKIRIFPEVRIQIAPTRFRVPDLCVFVEPVPDEQIFTHPPLLCIEILSPEDRIVRMRERVDDYFGFGVQYVWLIYPKTTRAWNYRRDGMDEVRDGVLRTENPSIEIPLAEIFNPPNA